MRWVIGEFIQQVRVLIFLHCIVVSLSGFKFELGMNLW